MKRQDRYSPPLWPDSPLPIPLIDVGPITLNEGGWLAPLRPAFKWESSDKWGAVMNARAYVTPPSEMHLREMRDVDRREPEQLRALVAQIGLPLNPDRPWQGVTSRLESPKSAERHHRELTLRTADQFGLPSPEGERPDGSVHVAEVALRLSFVRLMVDHLDRALSGQAVAPMWQSIGAFNFDDLDAANRDMPGVALEDQDPELLAWEQFSGMLNNGLRGISPRVPPPPLRGTFDPDDLVDSYTAACVLIFNDLQQKAPYSRCRDETCRRLFLRQIGRSDGGPNRSVGVTYCTAQHARNQSQRERRRRSRAERSI